MPPDEPMVGDLLPLSVVLVGLMVRGLDAVRWVLDELLDVLLLADPLVFSCTGSVSICSVPLLSIVTLILEILVTITPIDSTVLCPGSFLGIGSPGLNTS